MKSSNSPSTRVRWGIGSKPRSPDHEWYLAKLGFTPWLVVSLLLVIGAGSLADDRSSPPADSLSAESEQTDQSLTDHSAKEWIKRLGSKVYRERQEAFLRLWLMAGKDTHRSLTPLLEEAAASSDVDVSVSARWLMVLLKLSASPKEVAGLVEDLVLVRSGDIETLQRLAQHNRWDHLIAMLEVLTPKERSALIEETEVLSLPRARILDWAWEHHAEDRLPALVDLLWPLDEALNARRLWYRLGLHSLAEAPLTSLIEPETAEVYNRVLRNERSGNLEHAVNLARRLEHHELAASIALENGMWSMVSDPPNARLLRRANSERLNNARRPMPRGRSTRQLPIPPMPPAESTGARDIATARLALLAHWSDDEPQARKQAKAIGPPGLSETDLSGGLLALALTGQLEQAIDFAKKRNPDDAYETLYLQGRIDDALACLGLSSLDPASLEAWLKSQTSAAPQDRESDLDTTLRLAGLSCLLTRLGQVEEGKLVDQAVIEWASAGNMGHGKAGAEERRSQAEISRDRWNATIWVWTSQHRRPFALRQFQQLLREGIDEELRGTILMQLYRKRDGICDIAYLAASILDWFYVQRGGDDWVQAAADLEDLALGRAPRNWPQDWHRKGFPALGRKLLEEASDDEQITSIQLARLAVDHHRLDLAQEWLIEDADPRFLDWYERCMADPSNMESVHGNANQLSRSVDRLAVLEEIFSKKRDYLRASLVLQQISLIRPDRIEFALRRSKYLESIGESELARHVRLRALSIPISSSETAGIVDALEADQLYEESEILLRQGLYNNMLKRTEDWRLTSKLAHLIHTRVKNLDTVQETSTSDRTAFAKELMQAEQRQLLSRLDSFPLALELQYALPPLEGWWRSRARMAILADDFAVADMAIQRCHAIHPDEIETLIELYPLAKSHFGEEQVRTWLELYAQPLEKHLERWPDDTLIGNNLAWLYANVGTRLERALELSKHVAKRLPEDHIYLDTLAEVEFRIGNRERAIALSSQCRELAPLEQHHRTQLQRFLASPKKLEQ